MAMHVSVCECLVIIIVAIVFFMHIDFFERMFWNFCWDNPLFIDHFAD